jgi:hypothetical protein
MADELIIQHAHSYIAARQLEIRERLGFGIHGTVYVTEIKSKPGKRAIKALRERQFFERELEAYQRLADARVSKILEFHVPQLIDFDENLMVIEMTVVTRPFVLDFAGALMDRLPEFTAEIWDEWERQKRDQFGIRWATVERVLAELKKFGIYMIDVSPSNIAFLD